MAQNKSKKSLSKVVTLEELGEFTEKVILPGVEKIVEESISPLDDGVSNIETKLDAGFNDMRKGFANVGRSISVLAGEIMELKEREKDQRHEERILVLEDKVGVR